MKKIRHITVALFFMCLLPASAIAEKHLIFLDGYLGWANSMPPHLTANYEEIEKLPYSGFVVNGNVYTNYVMSADPNSNHVTYERVWNEVGSLKDVYQKKTHNFLRINLDFPGDFWNDAIWNKTTQNFAAVAKAAKNLGFKGILFDDEAYTSAQHLQTHFMSNFKFPKEQDVVNNPDEYEAWEKNGAEPAHADYTCTINGNKEENSENCAYRNNAYTFKEHMDKVAARFKTIMEAMENEFPDITLLVLHGPATAHKKTNSAGHYIKPNAPSRENEYKGAMFLGFKQGLNNTAQLHDMGEFYKYQTDQQFANAYQWRKTDMVSAEFNQDMNDSYQWVVPQSDRATWSQDINVGFMTSDYGLEENTYPEYNTLNACEPADAASRLTKALAHSDGYVIYYSDSALSECDRQTPVRWLDVASPVAPEWLTAITTVYNAIQPTLNVTAMSVQNITTTSVKIFWDVSAFATGQVEYGETTDYGHFSTKENSFDYDHHEQLLPNLAQGTTYHYRVISEDAQGNRVVTDDHTFTTSGEPLLSVSAISADNITKTTALILWDVSKYATGQVEYGETTAYGRFSAKEVSFNYNRHGQLLSNLKEATTYHYRVISQDAQGNSVTSEDHTFTTVGVNSGIAVLPVIISMLLDEDPPSGALATRPSYKDVANIPELGGTWHGAMGEHPVQKLTMANPWPASAGNVSLNIEIFFPSDVAGKKPTVFFFPGWDTTASETFHTLLYFIASQGFNAIFVPYDSSEGRNDPNLLLSTLDGIVSGPWSGMINTDKVGYSGHSAGGSMVFYLAKERSNWGTQGRFIFPLASWWSSHLPETGNVEYPANTNLLVQVYHDDAGTDPRQNIDFFLNNNINDERKSYLYLPGDANHTSDHDVPYSVDEHGNKIIGEADAYYFDALDQVGIYRPLESLMRYSFGAEGGLEWKAIGLPDAGDDNYSVSHEVNGISVVSTDNPLIAVDALGNYIVPIPVEEDLDDRYLCRKADNRSTMCMPCGDTSRNQAWQQCQYP